MPLTITDVAVFDGDAMLEGRFDVRVDGSRIAAVDPTGTPVQGDAVDGTGRTLLPGLVDAHVHIRGVDDLNTLAGFGVTTALDMGTWPPSLIAELKATPGTAALQSSGAGAIGTESPMTRMPGRPADSIVADAEDARHYVAARLAEGSDYIKVIVGPPGVTGPDQPTIDAIVVAAHEAGLRVVAHAADLGAVSMAQHAGVDVLTHVPLEGVLGEDEVARAVEADRTLVPTLAMMEAVAKNVQRPGTDFAHASDNVAALHRAGVVIVLGTDANQAVGVPANVPFGEGVHHELELLVGAGLTPIEALRSATGIAADRFELESGRITPGAPADLLLVEGDPTNDIRATRNIEGVWIAGDRIR